MDHCQRKMSGSWKCETGVLANDNFWNFWKLANTERDTGVAYRDYLEILCAIRKIL